MRDVPPGLQALLDSGASTVCYCWKVARKDGVILGFTSHDRPLKFDGVVFEAESGFNSSEIEISLGLSADSNSIEGAFRSDAITETDIIKGLYDGADVSTWIVDWTNTDNRLHLTSGFIGEYRLNGQSFEFEIKGYIDLLNKVTGRIYSPVCDCNIGDTRCKIDVTEERYNITANVVYVAENNLIGLDRLAEFDENWFDGGLVHWLSGQNQGVKSWIHASRRERDKTLVEFWRSPPLKVELGDTIHLTVGCEKSAKTCREKFDNLVNFRGFPHMPGDDWVVGYPSTGGDHNGGSLLRG